MPRPEFEHKSMSKAKYAEFDRRIDTRIGRIMEKLARWRPGQEYVFSTDRQRSLAKTCTQSGLHAVPRHQRGPCVKAAIAYRHRGWGPGNIEPRSSNYDIVGGLDYMATFASLAGAKLPEKDRDGQEPLGSL